MLLCYYESDPLRDEQPTVPFYQLSTNFYFTATLTSQNVKARPGTESGTNVYTL